MTGVTKIPNKFILTGLLAVAALLAMGVVSTMDFQQAFAVRQSAQCGNGIVVCPNVNACINAGVLQSQSAVKQNC
jgi:hypothetical protein